MNFNWSDLAFGSKKPLRELQATFISAPRNISTARFTELVKTYLPKGNIVLGISKEPYVLGFENQSQFKMMQLATVQAIIDKINAKSPNKIATLLYSQREENYIIEKIPFKKAVFIHGSWKQTFHTRAIFYALVAHEIPYELTPAFTDEVEAKAYLKATQTKVQKPTGSFTAEQMLQYASEIATQSYDYSFQTGVALGRKKGSVYEFLEWSFNKVVPYQTYGMLHGASREANFSPPHDLNHYDAVHAEVELIIKAQQSGLDLRNTTLFINLLPCPHCARMLAETDIAEFIYEHDHSDGYGYKMLEAAGKKITRIVR
jgi:deoxycytidylate deaminase